MSRLPIFLHPSPTESLVREFDVNSQEWSDDGSTQMLGRITLAADARSCTYILGEIWMTEGLFPSEVWVATRDSLGEQLASMGDGLSLYTVRLLQAMDRLLALAQSNHLKSSMKIEPMGRPHMHCARCRMTVVWPDDLADQTKVSFADLVRSDPVQGMRFAEAQFGLGAREAKVLVLHITSAPGVCRRCGKSVASGESLCSCRSVSLDW